MTGHTPWNQIRHKRDDVDFDAYVAKHGITDDELPAGPADQPPEFIAAPDDEDEPDH